MAVAPAAPLGAEAWEAWRAAESEAETMKRRLAEAVRQISSFAKLVAKVESERARRARVRTAFCKAALREKLLRARRRRAGRRIAGLVTIAMARATARRGGRAGRGHLREVAPHRWRRLWRFEGGDTLLVGGGR